MEEGRRIGTVGGLAVRPGPGEPMRVVVEALAAADGCLAGDHARHPRRGITLLGREQWEEVRKGLGADLPWHTRRANVLVEGTGRLLDLVGRTLRLGELEVVVGGETKPCDVMEEQHAGLRAALEPDGRGGVYGRIVRGGTVRVGDPVTLLG